MPKLCFSIPCSFFPCSGGSSICAGSHKTMNSGFLVHFFALSCILYCSKRAKWVRRELSFADSRVGNKVSQPCLACGRSSPMMSTIADFFNIAFFLACQIILTRSAMLNPKIRTFRQSTIDDDAIVSTNHEPAFSHMIGQTHDSNIW